MAERLRKRLRKDSLDSGRARPMLIVSGRRRGRVCQNGRPAPPDCQNGSRGGRRTGGKYPYIGQYEWSAIFPFGNMKRIFNLFEFSEKIENSGIKNRKKDLTIAQT